MAVLHKAAEACLRRWAVQCRSAAASRSGRASQRAVKLGAAAAGVAAAEAGKHWSGREGASAGR